MRSKCFSVFDIDLNHFETTDNCYINNSKFSEINKESRDNELLYKEIQS